jgi:hypothetical protein
MVKILPEVGPQPLAQVSEEFTPRAEKHAAMQARSVLQRTLCRQQRFIRWAFGSMALTWMIIVDELRWAQIAIVAVVACG